jgi:hypothetical protein
MPFSEDPLSFQTPFEPDSSATCQEVTTYLSDPKRRLHSVVISNEVEQEHDHDHAHRVHRKKYQQTYYELQLDQLETVRKYHFWRYKAVLYMVIVLFACSWLHHFLEYTIEVQTKHQYLVEQGEPLECHHLHAQDAEVESLSGWVYDYFFKDVDRQVCQAYRMELSQTDKWWLFPDLLLVTTNTITDTVIHPFQSICHIFYALPYLLQTSLYLLCTILLALYVVTRNIEVKWWSTSTSSTPLSSVHPYLNHKDSYQYMIDQC